MSGRNNCLYTLTRTYNSWPFQFKTFTKKEEKSCAIGHGEKKKKKSERGGGGGDVRGKKTMPRRRRRHTYWSAESKQPF